MAAMCSAEELARAQGTGFFRDPSKAPPEKLLGWSFRQACAYAKIAEFCADRRQHLQRHAGKALASIDQATMVGRIAFVQYETDMRLLARCEAAMRTASSSQEVVQA